MVGGGADSPREGVVVSGVVVSAGFPLGGVLTSGVVVLNSGRWVSVGLGSIHSALPCLTLSFGRADCPCPQPKMVTVRSPIRVKIEMA